MAAIVSNEAGLSIPALLHLYERLNELPEPVLDLSTETQTLGTILDDPQAKAVAAVFLVYDHHSAMLTKSLIDLQHTHTTGTAVQVISSLHVHLDEHDCLEVIVLRGRVSEIQHIAERILSMKGVKLGRVNIVAM